MSDQTPPPDGPEQRPDSGPDSEPTSTSGAEVPPATPEGAPEDSVEGAAAADAGATAPRGSNRGRLLAIIAAVVVIVLVAGGLVGYLLLRSDAHKLVTPSTAGSMKRDTAKEKTLSTQLQQAEAQFKTQGQGKCAKKTNYVKSAVYTQSNKKRGPEGSLVFLGARLTKEQVPTTWRSNCFTKQAKANGMTVTNVDPGDGGGKAVCASITSPQKIVVCAWGTQDTIGELVPTVAGYDAKSLSKIMRSVRSDVEQGE